jgi:tetratricopeptide (TPR) repeat protein
LLAITADQFYSTGSQHNDISKLELAAYLFPIERNIALGPSYYFLKINKPTEQALKYINRGLSYDQNSAELLQASMLCSFKLGKKNEAIRAYIRLSVIAPNSNIIKQINAN